ncbi:hypothetical protein [Nostoc sp.]|uniref:hypothetical protein n=1 Tax=Nostoc sp. TaxID=1180 RepID=UPI002FF57BDC
MTRELIYVAYAVTSDDKGLVSVCWHTEKQRASEVGDAVAKQDGLTFFGAVGCNYADYQAITSFPDDHPLNTKLNLRSKTGQASQEPHLVIPKRIIPSNLINPKTLAIYELEKLVAYVHTIDPELKSNQATMIAAEILSQLPELLMKNTSIIEQIKELGALLRSKPQHHDQHPMN